MDSLETFDQWRGCVEKHCADFWVHLDETGAEAQQWFLVDILEQLKVTLEHLQDVKPTSDQFSTAVKRLNEIFVEIASTEKIPEKVRSDVEFKEALISFDLALRA